MSAPTPGGRPEREHLRVAGDRPAVARGRPPARRAEQLRRGDVYPGPVVDGRRVSQGLPARLWRLLVGSLASDGERREAQLEGQLAKAPPVSRCNVIAVVSPKGGVGKTTTTWMLGNLAASHLHHTALAIDTNPDYGRLARLTPDALRSERDLADLYAQLRELRSKAEIVPYLSRAASGLHVLASPRQAHVMAELTPQVYGTLLEFVERFYDTIFLDLGTGIVDPLTQFALGRADQVVILTDQTVVTTDMVLDSLHDMLSDGRWQRPDAGEKLSLVINQARNEDKDQVGDIAEVRGRFRAQGIPIRRQVTVPFDSQLRLMLDTGTYSLEALLRCSRLPIKELGAIVAGSLR